MKKIFVFLLLMVVSFALKAQYPIQQNLGGDSTIIYIKGAAQTVGGFINGVYTDTAAANLTRIRQYQAAQIFTTNDSAMWFRMPGAKKWVRFMPATPPSPNVDTSYWSLSGNYVADRVATPKLGTTTGHELNIITNDSIRLTIPVYGIRRVTGNENRYLVIDTTIGSNMYVGYMDGGSGSTYTAGNGLTLSGSQFKLGGTLTENTTLAAVNYDFNIDSFGTLGLFGKWNDPNLVLSRKNIYTLNSDDSGTDGLYLTSLSNNSNQLSRIRLTQGSILFNGTTNISFNSIDSANIQILKIPTVSSTTGRKVALIDTATGKVERIDPASLVSTPTLQQVMEAGSEATVSSEIIIESLTSTVSLASSQEVSLAVTGKSSLGIIDSIAIKPHLGVLNIDSLRTWSGISDTTYKKPMTWDTRNGRWEYAANWPQQKINLVFGAGSGADSDTTAFTTSAIYGSFYNDADTIVVTSMRSVLQGTSPDVTYKVWYNDSLNVEAGATALVTAGSQVTNTTTGTNVTSFDVTKIPPGVWVWVKTSTVATKPKYFSLTVNGYRK